MTGAKAQVSGSAGGDDGDVSSGSSSLASMLAPMTGGVVIGAAIGVGQPGATHVHQEVTMTTTTQLRIAVSYTHLRAHETRHDLVCRLLLEKKKKNKKKDTQQITKNKKKKKITKNEQRN